MRVIVTGGVGFIGSHLCEYLIGKGDEVISVDNLGSGAKNNVKTLLKNKNFRLMKHDIIKPLRIGGKIDQIYHLASRASPKDFEKYPIEIALTNSIGTFNMLKLTVEKDARFLNASTSEVYGDPKTHPQTEDYWGNVNPTGVRSCYDESKRFSEMLSISYRREYGVDLRIARIFNTYGPRMRIDDGRVVPNFIVQALKNEPITVHGDGTQTRSFCYVSDMIEGLYLLMNANTLSKTEGAVNLGSEEEVKVVELARMIRELVGSSSQIQFKPLPTDDPMRRRADIKKAKRLLGWEPRVDLKTGLTNTIEAFRTSLKLRR